MGEEAKGREIVAILMGASAWPHFTKLNVDETQFRINPFKASKAFVLEYLSSERGLRLPAENILDLFDSEAGALEITRSIREFIQRRKSALEKITDVIFYYVGHGDYFERSSYYIATRHLDIDDIANSRFDITNVTGTLLDHAGSSRHVLIIDACYAAAAQGAYHMDIANAANGVKEITDKYIPKLGSALFCAAGPREFAKILPGQELTMFTGAFAKAIKEKADQKDSMVSLRQLGQEMQAIIREEHGTKGVLPEVHTPVADAGDIATIRMFPRLRDLAMGASVEQLAANVEQVQNKLAEMSNSLKEQNTRILDFENRLREAKEWLQSGEQTKKRGRTDESLELSPRQIQLVSLYREARVNSIISLVFSVIFYIPSTVTVIFDDKILVIISSITSIIAILSLISILVSFPAIFLHRYRTDVSGELKDKYSGNMEFNTARRARYTYVLGIVFIHKYILLTFLILTTYTAMFGISNVFSTPGIRSLMFNGATTSPLHSGFRQDGASG